VARHTLHVPKSAEYYEACFCFLPVMGVNILLKGKVWAVEHDNGQEQETNDQERLH